MKRFLLLLCLIFVASQAVHAAPAFVQETDKTCNATGSAVTTCTMTALNTTTGHALVVTAGWYTAGLTLSVTDTAGDSFLCLPVRFIQSTNPTMVTCVALNITGNAADVVTLTWSGSGSTFSGAAVAEYSGVNAIDNYDNGTTTNGASATPLSGFAGATHDTTELVIGTVGLATNLDVTAGSGYTLRSDATAFQVGIEDKNAANGSYAAGFTVSSTAAWAAQTLILYQKDMSQFVQEVDAGNNVPGATTPQTATYFTNTTATNMLFCVANWINNITISSVTDTQSNLWHLLPRISAPGGGIQVQGMYALNIAGGADTISIAFNSGGGTYISYSCSEFSGVIALDRHNENGIIATTTPTSPAVTTRDNGEILIGYGSGTSANSMTAGASWTSRSATGDRSLFIESQIGAAIGTYHTSFSASSSEWGVGIATFANANIPPEITSGDRATFFIGSSSSFTITSDGTPAATITKTGSLPSGITLTNNGDGTASLAGTPAMGSGGTYPLVITAANGESPDAMQNFTLRIVTNTLVQEFDKKCNLTGTPATTCTAAYPMNTVSGHLLFVTSAWFTNVTLAVTDSQGNTWKCLPRREPTGTYLQACYAFANSSAADTVTYTWSGSGSTFSAAIIGEWSGVDRFDNYDEQRYYPQNNTGTGNQISYSRSYAGATHDSNELVIGYGSTGVFTTWSANGDFTLRSTDNNVQLGLEDSIEPHGSYSEDFSLGSIGNWAGGVAIFYQHDSSQFRSDVDHDDGIAAQNTPDAVDYYENVSTGDLLFSVYVWVNSPLIHISSVTDTLGNTWTCLPEGIIAGNTPGQACYTFSGSSGADTVNTNFTGSGASFIGMAHGQWNGVTSLDKHDEHIVAIGNPIHSPDVTTSHPNELIIGYLVCSQGFVHIAADNSFTTRSSSVRSAFTEDQIGAPPGTYHSSFTSSDLSGDSYVGIAAFYAGAPRRRINNQN